jgi:hypothetical protein
MSNYCEHGEGECKYIDEANKIATDIPEAYKRIEKLEGALKNAYVIKELAGIHFKDTDEYYGIIDLCDEQIKHLEARK